MKALPGEEVTEGRDAVYIGRDAKGNPIPKPPMEREAWIAYMRRIGVFDEEEILHLASLRFANS